MTHRPEDLPAEQGLRASHEDPVTLIRRLKAEDSTLGIWLCGGGAVAGERVDEIDEFRLKVDPLILGAGVPLVAGGGFPLALTRRTRRDFESGVSYVEYSRS